MSTYLTAAEAAATLGVSVPTLYSYVSRGMLRSAPESAGKRRLYAADEVRRLARRKADGKRAGKVAQQVLDWGVPVLESRITLIAQGRLLYRGRDAIELARTATLEEAAAPLWECTGACFDDAPDAPIAPSAWHAWIKQMRASAPHERALVMLPVAAAQILRLYASGKPAQLDTAVTVLRVLAAALAAAPLSREPLHRQLAAAWGVTQRRPRRVGASILARDMTSCIERIDQAAACHHRETGAGSLGRASAAARPPSARASAPRTVTRTSPSPEPIHARVPAGSKNDCPRSSQ